MEIISQTFKGVIPPVRIDHLNGDGQIVPIIDWSAIAANHTPPTATNIQFEFVLEYLTVTHYLPTLLRIPGSSYPQFTAADKAIQRAAKLTEFKRNFSPDKNYAVQFLLWNWYDGDWRATHFDRDYLQNAGLEGRINLIKPFLVTAGDTIFGDKLHKLGMSITPRPLQPGDYIEISGGYSGSVSYLYKEPEIILGLGAVGGKEVVTTKTQILGNNNKRAALYVANEGTKRIYWRFDNSYSSLMEVGESPYLDPGQSLTYEHGNLISNGGDNHKFLGKFANSICKMALFAICPGKSKLVYQELVYP